MGVLRKCVVGLTVLAGWCSFALTAASADGYIAGSAANDLPAIWRGLYGGVHLGHADADGGNGVVGGVQLGYNWQSQRIVYGVEGDVSLSDANAIDWLASLRGRVGYLIQPRILLYGTAGLGLVNGGTTDTGFVYGLGVEGKITRSMSARVEYLAYDTDNNNGHHSHSDTVGVIRAGLNFKLNPLVSPDGLSRQRGMRRFLLARRYPTGFRFHWFISAFQATVRASYVNGRVLGISVAEIVLTSRSVALSAKQ